MSKVRLPKSSILVPLYIYPAPAAWEPLHKAITHHPNLTFIIVINPHSGPGAITGPDANYTREIARLNSYANVLTIGYIATGYAKRELAAVLQDIAIYSAWGKNVTSGLGMQGIFFDETPSQYEPSIAYFLDIAHAAVRSAVGFGSQCMVIDNPGTIPDTRYLGGADVTVVFEGKHETYQAENLGCAIMALQDDRTALACILHSALVGDEKLGMKKIVQELQKLAGSVFVTELSADYYSSFGTCWQAFVKEMEHRC